MTQIDGHMDICCAYTHLRILYVHTQRRHWYMHIYASRTGHSQSQDHVTHTQMDQMMYVRHMASVYTGMSKVSSCLYPQIDMYTHTHTPHDVSHHSNY